MRIPHRSELKSRKFIFIFLGILIALAIVFFIWQKYKYQIVEDKIVSAVAKETDRLYIIKYDSLSFDEALGNAYIKNIHIFPDTLKLKKLRGKNLPYVALDIRIQSINISGVETATALMGQRMVGDSVVIDQPEIIIYSLKPVNKKTKLETEASAVYEQILGNLKTIAVDYVFVNNLRVTGMDFFDKQKRYELVNGKIKLDDVLIDSAHNDDPDRVLFCKQAAFTIDSFLTYNNQRPELSVADVNFSGMHRSVLFRSILLNRFDNATAAPEKLLQANDLLLSGIHSDAIVKRKNIIVDSILCKEISFYQPPAAGEIKNKTQDTSPPDTVGFMHVYSVDMKHLSFPKVNFIAATKSNYKLGNIAIKVNGVKADAVLKVKKFPLKYSNEVELALSSFSMKSKDKKYDFDFKDIALNTLQKQLDIAAFNIVPYTSEKKFAQNEGFQKDRYDVQLIGITLKDIDMEDLLDEKIIASELAIKNTSAKIYRDVTKPLEKKSKVGNYPSQLLVGMDMPVNIAKATLQNAYIEYKEKQESTDSTGMVNFANSQLIITNITNIPSLINKNNALNIAFDTKVLRAIPLSGNFKFLLDSKQGNFVVNGHVTQFDPLILNKVSIPMALIRIKKGIINDIDFHLTGNNTSAQGELVMKYNDLKVDVLKRDKDSKNIKKRRLVSILANIIVRNNNPDKGVLRKETPSYERNIYKSFFSLVWKTVFDGMKSTVGIP